MHEDYLRLVGILKDRALIGPKNVSIQIAGTCNYNCLFCWYYSKFVKRITKTKNIPFNVIKNIVDDCVSMKVGEIAVIGKGEPFLHPQVYEIIAYVKHKGLRLSFVTNGSFDRKNVKSLSKVDSFSINLSASNEKTFRKLQCNRADAFQNVITNIEMLSRIRQLKGSPKITIVYLITALNFSEIKGIMALGKKYGVDSINFQMIFALPAMKKLLLQGNNLSRLSSILKDLLDTGDPFLKNTNLQILYNTVSEIKSSNSRMINLPDMEDDQGRIIYYRRKFDKNFRCYIAWYLATISLEGKVYSCCQHNSLTAGNIYRHSLKEIWFGRRFSDIRSRMKYLFDIRDSFWQRCHYCGHGGFLGMIQRDLAKIQPHFKK